MHNHNSQNFFIYARKSTDDPKRQIRSIDDQLAEVRELAAREGLNVIQEFKESQTAKKPGRPVFNDMLARIEKGEAAGILAWNPDRLARNSFDGSRIISLVDSEHIQAMKFPTYHFEPTAQGKFMLAIIFGQSKYYSDSLSEVIKRAVRQKLKDGTWPHKAPVGYLNDAKSRTIVLDPERAPLVKQAFTLYAEGNHTLDQVKAFLGFPGLTSLVVYKRRQKDSTDESPRRILRSSTSLSRSQFHRLLQNPFYCGIMHHRDEYHDGKHEPIITKALFDECQAVMKGRSKPKNALLKPYLYRRFFRCQQCGCSMTTETHKGHNYLRCTKRKGPCSERCTREEKVTEQIASIIRQTILPEEWINRLIVNFEAEQEKEALSWADEIKAIRTTINKMDDKLQRLTTAYVDGVLPLTDYRPRKNKLIEEKKKSSEELTFVEKHRKNRFEPAIAFIRGLTEPRIVIDRGDISSQRDFFRKTGSNFYIGSGRVGWEPRETWKHVVALGRLARHHSPASLLEPGTPAHTRLMSFQAAVKGLRQNHQPTTSVPALRISPVQI